MCVQTYGPGKSVAQICVFGLVAVAVLYECWFFDVFDKKNMMAVEIFVWNVDSAHILFFLNANVFINLSHKKEMMVKIKK